MNSPHHLTLSAHRLQHLVRRIHAEFQDMPGMKLTFAQVRRLWSLSREDCQAVLDYLVDAGVLRRNEEARFCRQG